MKKVFSLIVLAAATASVYADICPVCDGPMAYGKKMCSKCQSKSDRRTMANVNSWMKAAANTNAKRAAINKAAAKLAAILSHDGIEVSEKIRTANTLLKQVNAPVFYETIAAQAPLAVIKYYWPDPKNEKVYLASKKALEAGQQVDFGAVVQNSLQAMQGNVDLGDAPKKTRTAFALGRSKKDKSIRFVDSADFSHMILAAAIEENRPDVVRYFLKQTDGFDWRLRVECIARLLLQRQRDLQRRVECTEKLAEAEKKLKNADDQFDRKKYTGQINELKKELAAIPKTFVMDDEKGKILFGGVKRFELYMLEDWRYGLRNILVGGCDENMKMEAIQDIRNCAAKYCSPTVAKWIAKPDKNSFLVAVKMYWKDGSTSYTTKQSIIELPGYVLECRERHVDVKWCEGIPAPGRPGYVSGKDRGEFVWQKGLPDADRPGFISGAKEGEWDAAPGFRKSGDRMEWVPGTKHPKIAGVIAAKRPCSWIPDEKHLWVNPDNPADLSVREDRPVLAEILDGSRRNR